ncbi:MAG: hypothetical protein J6S69_01135 [Proteobacteria bacterium]|jgi:hypothetical protein|nr:hypothetical protein [Pseudomonadota bacterium]
MKKILIFITLLCIGIPTTAWAQDDKNVAPISFELDEEKLSIEADIPSVDLILSFREIQERGSSMKASFLDEIIESAKDEPF